MKRIDFPGLFPGMLAVRVGCMLGYRVGTATPALLMIQPRPAPGQTVLSKRLEIGPGLKTEQKADIHGNPVAKVLLPPNLTEIRYDAILLVPHHADMPSTRPSPPCMVVPKRPGSLSGPIRSTQHR